MLSCFQSVLWPKAYLSLFGAADAAGEHQRNGKGADVDEHGGYYSERCGKAEGVQEGGILKYAEVVLNAHKGGLAHSGEPLERKVNAPDKGPDKADDEREQRVHQYADTIRTDTCRGHRGR